MQMVLQVLHTEYTLWQVGHPWQTCERPETQRATSRLDRARNDPVVSSFSHLLIRWSLDICKQVLRLQQLTGGRKHGRENLGVFHADAVYCRSHRARAA